MNQLPEKSIRLLTSTQVITGPASVVKELVENSLDAAATSVEVRLDNFGLDRIEVRDNGVGISVSDLPYVAKKHYTSKITCHEDLGSLQTLGFRGEALGAIAALSDLEILTKMAEETVGRNYTINAHGDIIKESNVPTTTGTAVVVNHFYRGVPVRKQYYLAAKRKKEEMRLITELLMSYAIICYHCRFVLKHNKSIIWQKNAVDSLTSALSAVLTSAVGCHLEQHSVQLSSEVTCDTHIVKPTSIDNEVMYRASNDRVFIYVNKRCVRDKELEKLLKQYICRLKPSRYPICCLSFTIPTTDVDVNLEPDKTKVLVTNKTEILEKLEEFLTKIYSDKEPTPTIHPDKTQPNEELSAHSPVLRISPQLSEVDWESDSDVFGASNDLDLAQGLSFQGNDVRATSTQLNSTSHRAQPQTVVKECIDVDMMLELPPLSVEKIRNTFSLKSKPLSDNLMRAEGGIVVPQNDNGIEIISPPDQMKQASLSQYLSERTKDIVAVESSGSSIEGWVQGRMFDERDQPVQLARPPTHQPPSTQCDTRATKQTVISSEPSDGCFGSIIREETIPASYRKFTKISTAKKRKVEASPSNQPSVRDMFKQSKVKVNKTNMSSKEVEFSVRSLQSKYWEGLASTPSAEGRLIYCGSPRTTNGAVVLAENILLAFNPYVYKEREIYESLVKEYELPSEPTSITVVPSNISAQAWDALTALPLDQSQVVCDALRLNAFHIHHDGTTYEVTASGSSAVPGYGSLNDLEDVLVNLGTANYRPGKVLHHIQAETVRRVRSVHRFTSQDIIEMLDKMVACEQTYKLTCPTHSRPLFTRLMSLPSLS